MLVTVAVPLVFPAAIVTLAGSVATAVFLLESATTAPPEGAAPDKVTVACEVFPPTTVAGLSVIDESEAEPPFLVTVKLAEVDAAPTKAVIVTRVSLVTADVGMGKLAEICPAGTITIGGGLATRLLVDNVAVIPPAGAALLTKTVPVALVPPGTLAGLMVRDFRIGGAFGSGVTVTKTDFVTPPAVAITFPPVGIVETGLVATVKLIVLFPAAMITLAGT